MVSIGLACALGDLDWRRPVAWRQAFPPLAAWLEKFSDNEPAFARTVVEALAAAPAAPAAPVAILSDAPAPQNHHSGADDVTPA